MRQKENVDEDILSLGKGVHQVEIDLMQPIDPDKSPKVQTPALNHIGLWVDDLADAVQTLEQKGIKFTPGGIRKGAGMIMYSMLIHKEDSCWRRLILFCGRRVTVWLTHYCNGYVSDCILSVLIYGIQ